MSVSVCVGFVFVLWFRHITCVEELVMSVYIWGTLHIFWGHFWPASFILHILQSVFFSYRYLVQVIMTKGRSTFINVTVLTELESLFILFWRWGCVYLLTVHVMLCCGKLSTQQSRSTLITHPNVFMAFVCFWHSSRLFSPWRWSFLPQNKVIRSPTDVVSCPRRAASSTEAVICKLSWNLLWTIYRMLFDHFCMHIFSPSSLYTVNTWK